MHAALLLALALQTTPASKLGVVIADPTATDSVAILQSCPRVAVFLIPSLALDAPGSIGSYRTRCPGSTVVLHFSTPGHKYATTQDAVLSADELWNAMVGGLSGFKPAWIDWLEPTHELESVPDWTGDAAAGAWAANFFSQLADHVHNAGYNPLVGSIPSGAPKLAGQMGAATPNAFKPIADRMKQKTYPWGWSYHAFSTALASDVAQESGQCLRFRAIRDECGLSGVPVVLTEGGRAPPGWLSPSVGVSAPTYLAWLKWLDARLQDDGEVPGVGLFQFGDTVQYGDYELGSLESDLADWLATATFPDGGVGPVVPDGGGGGAGRDAAGSGTQIDPGGGDGVEVPAKHGCATVGFGALPGLAGLVALLALRRRRAKS